ncbi:MAG: sigma-54 dependent transcriptional regulator [Candidatus Omnitrophica bacterium]|nr:sigma-54 dependent transcriptional regulator [Candidatus Omnitrophota bacterium]
MAATILIVDDERLTRVSLQELLRGDGHRVLAAEDGLSALGIAQQETVDIVLSDMKMPHLNGLELLREIKRRAPAIEVVMMSAYGEIESAVEAMKLGAFDFITKPFDDNQLRVLIGRIIDKIQNRGGAADAGMLLKTKNVQQFYNIVGGNEKMQRIYAMIETVADSPSTVLIYGESGTGKKMIAQAIHQADTRRREKPFIEVSCGALPETLLESELFGHVKGSFTGAIKDRIGRFELADAGTIFLDEIDTCSPALQVKLLRVLQEGEFERVGEGRTRTSSARVIAATNQNLEELVRRKSFRDDLYWRLNVITMQLPPLRERLDDLELLITSFLQRYNLIRLQMKKSAIIEGISDDTLQAMREYSWPGNVRELENAIERACILVKANIIRLKDLPDQIAHSRQNGKGSPAYEKSTFTLKDALRHPERDIVLRALEQANWNCTKTAAYLGVNRTTLYNKMKLYGIKRGRPERTMEQVPASGA